MELKILLGLMIISCGAGSPLPECQQLPELDNAVITPIQSAYPLWSRVTFSCQDGYSHLGPEYSYCVGAGVWDPSPQEFTCLAQCKEPEVTPDVLHFPLGRDPESSKSLYNDEDVIQYACAEGNRGTLVGPTQATCRNGFWEPAEIPTCNHCSPPSVSDPKIMQLSPNQESYAANSEVRLSCPDDVMYTMKGTDVTYCGENGEWVPDPTKVTCHENCLLPIRDPMVQSSPLHGKSGTVDKVFKFNDVIRNTCIGEKLLVGPSEQRCVNGRWLPDRDVICQ